MPQMRLHKASGRARLRLGGRTIWLGPWGSQAARERYDAVVADWLRLGRSWGQPGGQEPKSKPGPRAEPLVATGSVAEAVLAYQAHADVYYRDATTGRPSGEAENMMLALRPLVKLYGRSKAADLDAAAIEAVQSAMVRAGLARSTVNARIKRIKRAIRWMAKRKLVPASVIVEASTVDPLMPGRTTAPEAAPIAPVAVADVERTIPELSAPIAAMVRLQLLTGARAGEVLSMRAGEVDLVVGEYRPGSHKGTWRGKGRVVYLGPQAVELLRPWVERAMAGPGGPEAYLFDPRMVRPDKAPHLSDRYSRRSYRQAIVRACRRAGVAEWSPLQLRHRAATDIRARFGLEAAQAVLGHARADVTQVYAERDGAKAREVMREAG